MKISSDILCTLSITVLLLLFTCTATMTIAQPRYNRTVEKYTIPEVTLINQDGEKVFLKEYLNGEYPVILEFIFATCTTICPILSIGFTNLQEQLGKEAENVRLVSISIDPEYDTPSIMKAYLQRYQAKSGWTFLTGNVQDINQTMRAFDAYVSDKMGHRPLTFLHAPQTETWVRIDGLMSGKELKDEYLQIKN